MKSYKQTIIDCFSMEYNQRIYYSGTTVGIGESAFSDAFQLDVYGRIRSDYNFDGFIIGMVAQMRIHILK